MNYHHHQLSIDKSINTSTPQHLLYHATAQKRQFNGLFQEKLDKPVPVMDINEARNDGVWNGSGIGWTTCKQSAPHSRQTTTPTSHHSIFTVQMLFLVSIQQCQSTERNSTEDDNLHELRMRLGTPSGISSTVTVAFVLLPLLEDQDSRHITKKTIISLYSNWNKNVFSW